MMAKKMSTKELKRFMGHDVSKWVVLRGLAVEMAEILDANPTMGFAELAEILNQRGWRNSLGAKINKNSITTALSPVFGDKYRRRSKSTKSKYCDRTVRHTHVIPENLEPVDPNSVFIATADKPNFTAPKTVNITRSSVISIKPKSKGARELVGTVIEGEDAKNYWSLYQRMKNSLEESFLNRIWLKFKSIFARALT
jgi:hypothetical protein